MGERQKRYRLQYLPLFWDDLAEAVLYIRDVLKSPEAAARLIDRTEEEILRHLELPEAAPVYKPEVPRPDPYHWFAVGNYMVFYVIIGDVMEVRRFAYGARDLTNVIPGDSRFGE